MSYVVKTPISHGVASETRRQKSTSKNYAVGDKIDLTPEEAFEIRHALENPPEGAPGMKESDKEAAESIRNNPENPDSGIEMFWKTQPDATKRTEANISQKERELAPRRQKVMAQDNAERSKRQTPAMPAKPALPVVPVATRPAPKK